MTSMLDHSVHISAWQGDVSVLSPDENIWAKVIDAWEFCMGGPTSGKLITSTGFVLDNVSSAIKFNDNGKLLAFSQYKNRLPMLLVLCTSSNQLIFSSGPYRVIEFNSFINSTLDFVDSPIHMPRSLTAEIKIP